MEETKFNYGIRYLEKVMESQELASVCRINGDYEKCFKALQDLYIWLDSRMTDEEKRTAKKLMNKAEHKVSSNENSYRYSKASQSEMIKTLITLEIFLRNVITKRKMDMPSKDDPSEAILG